MKNIVIVGSSGHAKVIIDIIEKENKYNIIGLIDAFRPIGDKVFDYSIIGEEKDIPSLIKEHSIYGCIIAIGDNWVRKIVSDKINDLNTSIKFITTIHPSATLGHNVMIDEGSVVMANTMIGSDTKIGAFCIVNTNSSIDHDCKMGNYASIAPGVNTGGNVLIEDYSVISIGANIIHNISIGKSAVIGAGSLVLKDVKEYTVEYGIPSVYIRTRKDGDKYL